MVISPWGEVVASLDDTAGPQIIVVDIDVGNVRRIRCVISSLYGILSNIKHGRKQMPLVRRL
jgi:predicted amidohydrolase